MVRADVFSMTRVTVSSLPECRKCIELMVTAEIHDDVQLCETIDFGSYPSWAMSDRRPVYIQLQLGPSPTVSSPVTHCIWLLT